MDATTILAIVSCGVIFAGWLVLPHSAAPQVKTVTPAREPYPVSA